MRGRLLIVAVVLVAAGCGGKNAYVVHSDGRIGPFHLDRTTEAEVRAKLGRPDGVIGKMDPGTTAPHGGRTIVYVCGMDCRTEYSFNNDTRALSDLVLLISDGVMPTAMANTTPSTAITINISTSVNPLASPGNFVIAPY